MLGGDKLKFDLTELLSGEIDQIDISDKISFEKESLNDAGMLDLSEIEVTGMIRNEGTPVLYLKLIGDMTVPCSITLKPVKHPFEIEVEDQLSFDKKDEYLTIVKNTIDILPIIWQNIVLEIPLKVVSDDCKVENMSGDGWEFVTDDNSNTIDPRLEKLTELLKERSE